MLRSMYTGVSGMKGFQTKLDVIGNNIANVNTVGFKKSTVNFQDVLSQNLSNGEVNTMQVGLGSTTSAINVIHTPGSFMTTGVDTDLSVIGDGFFVVKKPGAAAGEEEYLTRAGNFVLNEKGELMTSQGYHVLDSNKNKIIIDPATYDSFIINRLGEVIGKKPDGTETTPPLHILGISTPSNPSGLLKYGGSLYEMTSKANPNGALTVGTAKGLNIEIGSGILEMSNVDLTEEFTEMIIAQRGFQANSRTITTSDEILQEVVNLKR